MRNFHLPMVLLVLSQTTVAKVSQYFSDDELGGYSYCQANYPGIATYPEPPADASLLSLHVLTRHGDRAPVWILPKAHEPQTWHCPKPIYMSRLGGLAYSTEIIYSEQCTKGGYCPIVPLSASTQPNTCTSGQLTSIGWRQLRELGNGLRSIYVKRLGFLPASPVQDDWERFHIRSTETDRAYESAVSLVHGLFPSMRDVLLNITILPREIETTLVDMHQCPKLIELENKLRATTIFQEYFRSTKILREKFERTVGQKPQPDVPNTLLATFDALLTRRCNGFPNLVAPQEGVWTDSELHNIIRLANYETKLVYHSSSLTPQDHRLRIGGYLLEVKRNILSMMTKDSRQYEFIKSGSRNQKEKDFILHSSHDRAMSFVLAALDFTNVNGDVPPYAANIVIELWSRAKQSGEKSMDSYLLRFLYNGRLLRHKVWCPTGECLASNFLNYLDSTLELVGGFESYHSSSEPAQAVWNFSLECQLPHANN